MRKLYAVGPAEWPPEDELLRFPWRRYQHNPRGAA